MVFAAVGERLAVSGKRKTRERDRDREVGGGWQSGGILVVSFASRFVFPLAPALFFPRRRR